MAGVAYGALVGRVEFFAVRGKSPMEGEGGPASSEGFAGTTLRMCQSRRDGQIQMRTVGGHCPSVIEAGVPEPYRTISEEDRTREAERSFRAPARAGKASYLPSDIVCATVMTS